MRKIIILLLVILLVGGLCGCRKEEDNTSSIASSAETESTQSDDRSKKSEGTNSVESGDSSSSETPSQSTTTDSSKKQTDAASTNSSASAKNDKPDSDPTPQAKDKTSLDGDWIFYTSDWVRTGGTDCFVICLNIYNGFSVNISKGGYSLAENTVIDITKAKSKKINGKIYYQEFGYNDYGGSFFVTVGKEDKPVLELKCYDEADKNFLTDELEFKRIDNNTLQYVGADYEEIELCTGDIFKRY